LTWYLADIRGEARCVRVIVAVDLREWPVADLWFSRPVSVRTERPGVTYNVNNVEDAAEQLVKWTKCGPKWNKAVRVCLAALAGELTPEDARIAFKAAANEEGMLVPSVGVS
jgi:hypothetical protein